MKLGFFVLGTAVGAIGYACFAPRSGSEVRADVADVANQGKAYAQDKVNQVKSAATEIADQAKDALAS